MKTLNTLVKKNVIYIMLKNITALNYYAAEINIEDYPEHRELLKALKNYSDKMATCEEDKEIPSIEKIYKCSEKGEGKKAVLDYMEIVESIELKKFRSSLYVNETMLKSVQLCEILGKMIDECEAIYGNANLENWNKFLEEKGK